MESEKGDIIINAKELRNALRNIVQGAKRGQRYTVLYRSYPAFRIIPVDDVSASRKIDLASDPLYKAGPLGRTDDGDLADNHDEIIYGETP